ncbi:Ribonuclease H [Gracilaria domingensis]|nr:Ribonuclease H [Gracilaria domingensis]
MRTVHDNRELASSVSVPCPLENCGEDPNFLPVQSYVTALYIPGSPQLEPEPQTVPAASYAVYLHSAENQVRVAQPLAASFQDYRTASLKALLCALQLGNCLCLQHVHVVCDDDVLVDLFDTYVMDTQLSATQPDDSQVEHLTSSENMALWRAIQVTADAFKVRGAVLHVIRNNDSDGIHIARQLARSAITMHQYCSRCESNYGPLRTPHSCDADQQPPLKRTGSLVEGTDDYGRARIVAAVCPKCSATFEHLHELERHVECDCPEVLEEWFAHTKIVKN